MGEKKDIVYPGCVIAPRLNFLKWIFLTSKKGEKKTKTLHPQNPVSNKKINLPTKNEKTKTL
ncbi:hypothetical protein ACVGXP_17540, partial [Enterobacter hormaechei]